MKRTNKQLDSDSDEQNQQINSQQQQQLDGKQHQEPGEVAPNGIEFGDSPVQLKCPFCLQNVRSQIILKPEFISILLAFVLFVMLPHLIMLVVTIVILQLTATRKHRCPLCERELGTDGKFLVFFTDQVYSLSLGSSGLLITKKILYSIGLVAVVFAILGLKASDAYAQVVWTDLTWDQFSRQCFTLEQEQTEKCLYSNQGLTVKNWKGFVMRVEDNRLSPKRRLQYSVTLFVKMNSPRTLETKDYFEDPDLFLTINNYQAYVYQEMLDNLSHGDEIVFNATFQFLGNSRNIGAGKHLNVVDMHKTGHKNSSIHVYMDENEDLWFFEKLSGSKKLRNHHEDVDLVAGKSEEQIDKIVEEELQLAIEDDNVAKKQEKRDVVQQADEERAEQLREGDKDGNFEQ